MYSKKKFFGTDLEMTVFYKFAMRSCYTGHVYILVCRIWSCSQKIAKCVSNCRAECTVHYSQRKSRCRRFSFSMSRSASFGKFYENRSRLALHFVLALSSKFWCVSSSGLVMGPLTHTIDFYHRRTRRWRNGFLHVNLVKQAISQPVAMRKIWNFAQGCRALHYTYLRQKSWGSSL